MIKVSVIVPIYNSEQYISRCVKSLINQTLENIEIILVNDGSSDNSYEIIKEFQKNNDNIKVINKKNSGVGDTTLNLDRSPKNMKISGGTGDCDLKIKEVNGEITYSGGVGDLSIIVPENAPIKIKTSSGIGDRHIDAKVSEENKYTFNLDNGLGDIKVTN